MLNKQINYISQYATFQTVVTGIENELKKLNELNRQNYELKIIELFEHQMPNFSDNVNEYMLQFLVEANFQEKIVEKIIEFYKSIKNKQFLNFQPVIEWMQENEIFDFEGLEEILNDSLKQNGLFGHVFLASEFLINSRIKNNPEIFFHVRNNSIDIINSQELLDWFLDSVDFNFLNEI